MASQYPRIAASLLRIATALFAVMLFAAPIASAQTQTDAKPGVTAESEFSRQLDELKKSFAEVGRNIDESAKSIDAIRSPEQGRKSIEDLREQVSRLLDAVADNGNISKLGAQAMNLADEKLRALDRETRFKPEEKQYLIVRWRELRTATETAIRTSTSRARISPSCCARCKRAKITSAS